MPCAHGRSPHDRPVHGHRRRDTGAEGRVMSAAPGGEVIVYEAPDGEVRVDVRLDRETVWLTQAQMSELFGRERSVVTKHVGNAFREGELDPAAVCAKLHILRRTGKPIRSTTTTSTSSFRSAIASSHCAAPSSASGPPERCASTWCAATRSTAALRAERARAGGCAVTGAQGSRRRGADVTTRGAGWSMSLPAIRRPSCSCNAMTKACWKSRRGTGVAFCRPWKRLAPRSGDSRPT